MYGSSMQVFFTMRRQTKVVLRRGRYRHNLNNIHTELTILIHGYLIFSLFILLASLNFTQRVELSVSVYIL